MDECELSRSVGLGKASTFVRRLTFSPLGARSRAPWDVAWGRGKGFPRLRGGGLCVIVHRWGTYVRANAPSDARPALTSPNATPSLALNNPTTKTTEMLEIRAMEDNRAVGNPTDGEQPSC